MMCGPTTPAALICPICKQQTCDCLLLNRQFLAREVGKLMKGEDGSIAINKLMRGEAGSPATQKMKDRQKLRDQYGGNYYCYATPVWLRETLVSEYGYPELDVASSHNMEFGTRHYTPDVDGLEQNWVKDSNGKLVFGNPPYAWKELGRWVEKAFHASQAGCAVILILPFWRKYEWFGKFIVPHAEVRLPAVPVLSEGFGPMAGKQCGNTNWHSEYETIVAIFRAGQKGFLGEWIFPKVNMPMQDSDDQSQRLLHIEINNGV